MATPMFSGIENFDPLCGTMGPVPVTAAHAIGGWCVLEWSVGMTSSGHDPNN